MLSYSEFGDIPATADTPALIIVHGLYGSGRNWGVIAKRLSDSRRVITVDMRNHGTSPRMPSQSYPNMAQDLADLITHLNIPVDVCGHSMGGKAAMVLALTKPKTSAPVDHRRYRANRLWPYTANVYRRHAKRGPLRRHPPLGR